MNFRRHIDRSLASGRGRQLIIVIGIIALAFFVFWGISVLLFGSDSFGWQDIIALFLDPGVFGGAGNHDWFRLLVTIVGVILVAAMLISVFSNIFENISDSYTKGEIRYKFKDQILIIGANENLFGLLEYIRDAQVENPIKRRFWVKKPQKKFGKKQIIVMTLKPVETLRDEVEAYFNDSRFTNRIIFYFDRRDNLENLKRAGVIRSNYIFILGEDGEDNHDIMNLTCVKYVRDILKNRSDNNHVECLAVMNSQTTMKAYQKYLSLDNDTDNYKISYTENIININECLAEQALRRTLVNDIKGLGITDTKDINVVILGMSALGRALATTVSYTCHFRNKRHTHITIIDNDIKTKVNEFKSRYHALFEHCNSVYSDDITVEIEAGDNISWKFIDASSSSPEVTKHLAELNSKSHLYIYVCHEDIRKNVATEVSLRNLIDGLKVFSDFGKYDSAFEIYADANTSTSAESFRGILAGLKPYDLNEYIFCTRQEDARKDFDKSHKNKWSYLTFSDKLRRVYENIVKIWWGNNCDYAKCLDNIFYLAVYGENGDNFRKCMKYIAISDSECEYFNPEACLKTQNALSRCLEDDIEADLADYLRYELKIISHNSSSSIDTRDAFVLSKDFMDRILTYANNRNLTDETTEQLLEIVRQKFETRVSEYRRYRRVYLDNTEDINLLARANEIKDMAKQVLKIMHDNGNRYATLCLSMLEFEKDKTSEKYINLFREALEDKDLALPLWCFSILGEEGLATIYTHIPDYRILDLYIKEISFIGSFDDMESIERHARTVESKVRSILGDIKDGELFFRLASCKNLDYSLRGMWLIKAKEFFKSERDNANLAKILYSLGDYFAEIGNGEISKLYFEEYNRVSSFKSPMDEVAYYDQNELVAAEEEYNQMVDNYTPETIDEQVPNLQSYLSEMNEAKIEWDAAYPNIPSPFEM